MWKIGASEKGHYLPVAEGESEEMISGNANEPQTPKQSSKSLLRSPWILHLAAFVCYSVAFGMIDRHPSHHDSCVKKLSMYSPALEAASDDYKSVRWSLTASNPSPWVGPPSKKVDEAWQKFTNLGALVLSHDDLVRINGSRYSARVPKEVGDGYIAHVEWYHQLHCVYMLWQQTYPEWYTEEAKMREEKPELWHEHLDHCAETLRAAVMCHADANVVPSNWVKGRHWPHPNYNLEHKCRDFDAAYQWAYDHQANPPPGFEMFARPEEGGYSEYDDLPFDPFDKGTVVPLKEKTSRIE